MSKLFNVLSSKNSENIQEYLTRFPYVNGGLFDKDFYIPKFNKEARSILIEGGSLNWAEINPDILGSMMQAIVSEGVRHEIGMHYTSSSNILKTIKPLFLDDLYKKLLDADKNLKKLKNLLLRIYNISIFDPACGSGNFLVITYKELYKIEIQILKKIDELENLNLLSIRSVLSYLNFMG